MTKTPKISVLFPVYNAEKYLVASIESILNQTYTDFELLALNDGSTDNSLEMLNTYAAKDNRIKIVENDTNQGLVYTLNKGIEVATGEYFLRIDSDDIAMPNRFEKQVAFLDAHPKCVALGTNYELFGVATDKSNLKLNDEEIRLQLFFENAIGHSTSIIRKSALIDNDIRYNKALLHVEDWGLWMDLSKVGELANLKDNLLKYRMEGQNITQKNLATFEQRVKAFYNLYLNNFYTDLKKETIDAHWKFSKVDYKGEPLEEIYAIFARVNKALVNAGFSQQLIQAFLNDKRAKFFYKIADSSAKKGFLFALKTRQFGINKLRYALSRSLKNNQKK